MLRVMEPLFLCLRELVKKQGCGYDFTISENESTILLFWAKRENDFLFGAGRDYDFTVKRSRKSKEDMPCYTARLRVE